MQYVSYLRWGTISGLFLVPFISLIVAGGQYFPSMFFPYITGKNFAFRILIEILLALYVLLALRDPKYRPRSSLIGWTLLAFVVWMGVATVFSVDPVKSFWSNFERMEGYLTVLHLFVYFVVAGAVLTAERLWERFFQVSIGVSMFQGLYALFQIFGILAISSQSGPRVDTTFGNAAYLAVFLLIHVFITLFMLARERRSRWLQIFYCSALLLQLVGLFYTQTRGAMLGVAGGLVIAALFILWQARGAEWKMVRRWSLGVLAGVVILTGLIFVLRDTTLVQQIPGVARLASISLEERTVVSRLVYIWPMALKGALERPLIGWGQENFNFIFNKYYDPGMYDQEEWFDRAHNQFLDWLIAGGVPAFLLYLSLYVLAAWAIFRTQALKVPEQAALLGLLAAYGFHNLFVFDNIMSAIYFFMLLAFCHGLSRNELSRWMFLYKPLGDRPLAIAAPLVLVVLVVAVYNLNAPGLARAQILLRGLQASSADIASNIVSFKEALALGPLGKQEAVEQTLQFASSVAASSAIAPEVKQEMYTLAYESGGAFLKERPQDARLELIFASFLAQNGKLAEALQHLEAARASSPLKQRILFQTGITLIQGGAVEQALVPLKEAFELEPRYDQARIYYVAGLFYASRGVEADALLVERFGTTVVDNEQLLGVYADTKQYERVIGIWQLRVQNNPTDAQTHIGLATAYFTAGDNESAIAELQRAAQLDLSLATQIQAIISQIKSGQLKP